MLTSTLAFQKEQKLKFECQVRKLRVLLTLGMAHLGPQGAQKSRRRRTADVPDEQIAGLQQWLMSDPLGSSRNKMGEGDLYRAGLGSQWPSASTVFRSHL